MPLNMDPCHESLYLMSKHIVKCHFSLDPYKPRGVSEDGEKKLMQRSLKYEAGEEKDRKIQASMALWMESPDLNNLVV